MTHVFLFWSKKKQEILWNNISWPLSIWVSIDGLKNIFVSKTTIRKIYRVHSNYLDQHDSSNSSPMLNLSAIFLNFPWAMQLVLLKLWKTEEKEVHSKTSKTNVVCILPFPSNERHMSILQHLSSCFSSAPAKLPVLIVVIVENVGKSGFWVKVRQYL